MNKIHSPDAKTRPQKQLDNPRNPRNIVLIIAHI